MQKKEGKFLFLLLVLSIIILNNLMARSLIISSPNGDIKLIIETRPLLKYQVRVKGKEILKPSALSLTLDRGRILGSQARLQKISRRTVNKILKPVIRVKSSTIQDIYAEIILEFKGNYSVIFRVYNDGVAYRFKTSFKRKIKVVSEGVNYHFPRDFLVYFPQEKSMFTHQERTYKLLKLSEIDQRFCSIPALVVLEKGVKIALTEADLIDYPGMYLQGEKETRTALKGIFPPYPLEFKLEKDRHEKVVKTAGFLAQTDGSRTFPWRVMVVSLQDAQLIESQMVYKLAAPCKIKDTSWIKPGKVAWDWWNAWNISGVNFTAGVNTRTYKYYIDFAAKNGIEYIILDEGWYKLGDLFSIVPSINMPEILAYGKKKKVGIILWVIWKTLENQFDEAMKHFNKWGVKGLKVDFMQREDQRMVNFYHRVAKTAAKYHMLIDFHGSYKPTGLRRTYPNVLTREGVKGLEHNKWGKDADPENALIIPFVRMLAGPLDYTPGAMINAGPKNFRAVWDKPMSRGTRCHQLAMYVVYESPLQMLADNPSHYLKEQECLKFLSCVPTVWDQTVVLGARVSDYIWLARKSGDKWFLGAMTDWTARKLKSVLSFLGKGEYEITMWQDGPNAHRYASDYKISRQRVNRFSRLEISLAPGGGWAAVIRKSRKLQNKKGS